MAHVRPNAYGPGRLAMVVWGLVSMLGVAPAAGQTMRVAGFELPERFDVDMMAYYGGARREGERPEERSPERFLIHFDRNRFAGQWSLKSYPRDTFGYSLYHWTFKFDGQLDAAGRATGKLETHHEVTQYHRGKPPTWFCSKHHDYRIEGQVNGEGNLAWKLIATNVKWLFREGEKKPPEIGKGPIEQVLFLPVKKNPDTPAPPPAAPTGRLYFVPRIATDKTVYRIGERVVVSLEIEEWAEVQPAGEPVRTELKRKLDNGVLDLTINLPQSRQVNGLRANLETARRAAPLAPIVLGTYRIEARVVLPAGYLREHPEIRGELSDIKAEAAFECQAPDAALQQSAASRIAKLEGLFKTAIPSHRKEVEDEFYVRNPPQKVLMPWTGEETMVFSKPVDMKYGSYNNAYFHHTDSDGSIVGNDWVCGNCQKKTLSFLNHVRFEHADRELLIGIHHGPIVRGFPNLPLGLSYGEHHGVVVYRYDTAYNLRDNRVFDPWPRQIPDVFPFWRFEKCYIDWDFLSPHSTIGAAPDEVVYKLGPLSGFPTHGSLVYWNEAWHGNTADGSPLQLVDKRPKVQIVKTRVICKCPVVLDVSDAQGRHTGVRDGKLVREIPDSDVSVTQPSPGDFDWYIALPAGEHRIRVTAMGRGPFCLQTAVDGVVRSYRAAIDKGQTAELRLVDAQPDASLMLPNGKALPPAVSRPREPGQGSADGQPLFVTAGRLQQLRRQMAEASRLPEDTPVGWSKSRVDPGRLVALAPPLKIRSGFVLRAYQFKEDVNGNGCVWAMPAQAEFPAPEDCPRLENHLFKSPKPSDALDDAMEAIEGDGSPWSYLMASLLRRELAEFGAFGHGCRWLLHTVLDADPWKAGTPPDDGSVLDRPSSPAGRWKWFEPQPKDWRPQVRPEKDRVTVTFYTYSGYERQAIYRHVDTYRPGKYRPKVEQKRIAEGPEGFLP